MDRRAVVAGAIVAAAVVVVTVAVTLRGDSAEDTPASTTSAGARSVDPAVLAVAAGLGDPGDVDVPVPADDRTRVWLTGEGDAAAQMIPNTELLWAQGAGACAAVADALDEAGSPEDILAAAGGTPHEPTRELLVSLHTLIGSTLGSCADAGAFEEEVAVFAWQWAVTERHLREIGVL